MATDLFEKRDIKVNSPRDLLAEKGIVPSQKNSSLSFQDILNKIPTPNQQFPLMNIVSGAMGSVFPEGQKQLIQQIPQIITNQPYNMPQKIETEIGGTVPALLGGGESLAGQMAMGAGQGYLQDKTGKPYTSALQNALLTLGVGKAIPFAAKVFSNPDKIQTAKEIQAMYDMMNNKARSGFEAVTEGVNSRGINQVPITLSTMTDLPKYFPNTLRNKKLINDAIGGDFNALRDIQSDLWTRGTKNLSSPLAADRNMGEEMLDARDKINDSISKHLINTGHTDLNDLLNESRAGYANLKQTFFPKKMPSAIKNLVHPESREVPENIFKFLKKDSKPINRLKENLAKGSFSPDQDPVLNINQMLENRELNQNAMKWLKRAGIGSGLVAGGYGLYKTGKSMLPAFPGGNEE